MAAEMSTLDWIKYVYSRSDPRMDDYFLLTGIGPIAIIIVTYIYFSVWAGPKYMKDKKPYNLNNVLIIYNFLQVLISLYLCKEGLMSGWWNDYKLVCEPVGSASNPKNMRMAHAVYAYFICKIIELLDTIFFVFRKKQNQISFLHVYHHAIMPLTCWMGARYFPSGHVTLLGMLNSIVHVVMYTYYMLSAFGPAVQKYLWWKKYITVMQIVQFILIFTQNFLALYFDCSDVPNVLHMLLCINAILFIYMFSSFYVKTYRKTKPNMKSVDGKLVEPLNGGVGKSKVAGKNGAHNKFD